MSLRDRALEGIALQLSQPHGAIGRVVGPLLDCGNAAAIRGACDATGAARGQVVADVGFGGGAGLSALLARVAPGGIVHGIELSPAMLDRARRRHRDAVRLGHLMLHPGDLRSLPLPDAALHALVTVNTFYFVPDLPPVCAELNRVLRPEGTAVVGIADPATMEKIPYTAYRFVIRPVDEVCRGLESAGLELVEDRSVGDGPGACHLLITRKR
mgnify:CR=1 FL=1